MLTATYNVDGINGRHSLLLLWLLEERGLAPERRCAPFWRKGAVVAWCQTPDCVNGKR